MSIRNKKLFAITTGDSNGIGLEVTVKALVSLQKRDLLRSSFLLFRRKESFLSANEKTVHKKLLKHLDTLFYRIALSAVDDLQVLPKIKASKPILYDYATEEDAPIWVEEAAQLALNKQISGIITAPLSKTLIRKCGLADIGHTDILKRVSKTKNVYMTFLGDDFHVTLLTGHIPLKNVSSQISSKKIEALLSTIEKFFPFSNQKKIGLLGLNPHAGDQGLIGTEEKDWLKDFVSQRSKNLLGPLVPDAAFQSQNWKKISIYIALYHDQGLIPFKLHHGMNGVHYSMGLPFIRTSVDHGTAFDLFGKNKADPQSMVQALLWAQKMARSEMTF